MTSLNQVLYLYEAELARVIDGDTVDVKLDVGFKSYMYKRIRVNDIDTFELHTTERKRGVLAKTFVENLFSQYSNKCYVRTHRDGTGIYGRVIGDIYFKKNDQYLDLAYTLWESELDKTRSSLTESSNYDDIPIRYIYTTLEEILK